MNEFARKAQCALRSRKSLLTAQQNERRSLGAAESRTDGDGPMSKLKTFAAPGSPLCDLGNRRVGVASLSLELHTFLASASRRRPGRLSFNVVRNRNTLGTHIRLRVRIVPKMFETP